MKRKTPDNQAPSHGSINHSTIRSQLMLLVQKLAAKRPSQATLNDMPVYTQSILLDTFSIHDTMDGVPVYDLLIGIPDHRRVCEPRLLPGGQTAIELLNRSEQRPWGSDTFFFALRLLNGFVEVHFVINEAAWGMGHGPP